MAKSTETSPLHAQPNTTQADVQPQDEVTLSEDARAKNASEQPPDKTGAPAGDKANGDARYQELYDQYVRLQADFQNYRKRIDTEKDALLKYGSERTLTNLLPVLDNLSRGTASLSENSDPKVLYQSFSLVLKQLLDGMNAQGLQKMDVVGKPFDPNFHEAVQHMPSADHAENTVMAEAQAGYMLYDRVLRPALVVVSSGKTTAEDSGENPFTHAAD